MKQHIILKGWHYSLTLPKFHKTQPSMTFVKRLRFTDSCRYVVYEPSCVNKLFGFCYGFGVHKNSVRFGWTYDNNSDKIIIWLYAYRYGKLNKNKVAICDINKDIIFAILCENDETIRLYKDGVKVETIINVKPSSCFITELTPYFGGNSKAPHKIIIKEL